MSDLSKVPPVTELPDDMRVPLHSLQADMRGLIARARREGDEVAGMVIDAILNRLSQIEMAAYRLANVDAQPMGGGCYACEPLGELNVKQAAFLAMIEAWPGVQHRVWWNPGGPQIILPLPQEAP